MLAIIFRGIFFMGVVGWYSTSLWKMIDGYFKDQFQRYLEDEYQRNPKMREDVRVHATTVDKSESSVTDAPTADSAVRQAEMQRLLESCGLNSDGETCPAGKAETGLGTWREEDESVPAAAAAANAFAAGAAEEEVGKEVARPVDAKEAAFRERPREDGHAEPPDEPGGEQGGTLDIGIKQEKTLEPEKQKQPAPQIRKKRRSSGRPQIGAAKSEEDAKRKKRRYDRIQTLTLTDDDFDSASRKRRFTDGGRSSNADRDFSEFDEEDNRGPNENHYAEEEEEATRGIPVADLPFTPLIDIYDLERLPGEEYCPLTLEDDPSCEETRSWP